MMIGQWDVGVGDRVTVLTPQGQERSGKVMILNAQAGVAVLNGGGKYGTPVVACEGNIVRVKAKKPDAYAWGVAH